MAWSEYDNRGSNPNASNYDPLRIGMVYGFNIEVKAGEIIIASSDGKDNGVIYPEMFDRFQITVDQLEGEINLPYELDRRLMEFTIFGNQVIIPIQAIKVPRSQLGGFTQFRINYQYVDQATETVYSGEVITERTIVPRRPFIPPPPPPPVFTIDDGQIKEALADKIYEKFFNSETIQGSLADLKSFQSTRSPDGIGYKMGRQSDDEQLIFFKKDRNTPENAKDFYNDDSDDNPINRIALAISGSLAGTDANGVVDLSDKLDNELTIEENVGESRVPSSELDPPLYVSGTETPLYYIETVSYNLIYTVPLSGEKIFVPFASYNRFYQQATGDLRYMEVIDGEVQPKPDEWVNSLNLSQLTKPKRGKRIDINKARDVLDTNIFELLPNQSQRQNVINDFFDQFNSLIGPKPSFSDVDDDGAEEFLSPGSAVAQQSSRISTNPDNPTAYITRTDAEANDENQSKTLESMRNELNDYLGDVDNVIEEFPQLPEYVNKSEGFLKLRKYNQAIIIRNPTDDLQIEKESTIQDDAGNSITGPTWAVDGFTITMWVRFLNTTTNGSLMTYGNPLLKQIPGFRLETFSRTDINNDEESIPRRIIRLSVWENTFNPNGALYDSHVAHDNRNRQNTVELGKVHYGTEQQVADGIAFSNSLAALRDSHSPASISTADLNEWFFICATYDPLINEEDSFDNSDMITNKQFWLNHVNPNGTQMMSNTYPYGPVFDDDGNPVLQYQTVANSGFGAKCKVEVISRSDLLTARGFEV